MTLNRPLAALALGGTLLLGGLAQAQAPAFFRIGTGGAGGTYFPIGGAIANAISAPPGSRACEDGGQCGVPGLIAIAQSTNASVQNNLAVENGELEAGMTGASTLQEMYFGQGKFEGKTHEKLRVVANLFPEDLHLVIPKGMQLDGLADLAGKRVGIGQAGSGTQVNVLDMLAEFGVTRDNMEEAELDNSQSSEQLADGQLDAYFYAAGWPVAAMVQLANTKGMDLYSFTDEEVAKSTEVLTAYVPSTIPEGAYEGVDHETKTIAVSAILAVSADQPEEMIHDITAALWNENTRTLLDSGHAKGKQIRPETALLGIEKLGVPLHPGAERFYREAGMMN